MSQFLWGSATAAYQCEGGWQEDNKSLSNWDAFCHSEKNNVNPVTGDVASDVYHRYEEDIEMLAAGGQNAYRFSLAWTRIIDCETGQINESGLAFYDRIIEACHKHGVEPFVTLYHYDLPNALFQRGGWENRNTTYAFAQYAKACFEHFTSVKYWATVNEPNYDTLCCYGIGNYPPNVQDLERRWKAMYHIMLASAKAIKIFKDGNYQGTIGLVSDSYSIETRENSDAYMKAKHDADIFLNTSVNDVCIKGVYPQDYLDKLHEDGYDLSYMKEEDKDIFAAGTVDFLGVNAYNRVLVKPYTGGKSIMQVNNTGTASSKNEAVIKGWFVIDEDPDTEKNPWGMEVYPQSIYNLLKELSKKYPDTPFIITENGIGYYDELIDGKVHDDYRINFLNGYVDWMIKAKDEGIDVRGYFIWSTMDLYSWINGYKKRYGLVYIDYDHDNKRYPKDSYYWYKEKILNEKEKENG